MRAPAAGVRRKIMNRSAIFLTLLSAPVYAGTCTDLTGSGDGVPAIYYQEKCYADIAFDNGEFAVAALHYEKASAVTFHEAPNYRLRLEWAESLCLAGNNERGLEILDSFVLMVKADLGYLKCPDSIEDVPPSEHMQLACIGYGSILSEEARMELKNDLESVSRIQLLCADA